LHTRDSYPNPLSGCWCEAREGNGVIVDPGVSFITR
jgi:hypothetical protein